MMNPVAWARLYHHRRADYLECEAKEQELRDLRGDVSMMRESRSLALSAPQTLAEFRARLDRKAAYDLFDEGGRGCFAGSVEAA